MASTTGYPQLFERSAIGTMALKNRIIMAPMATNFASVAGEVTPRMIDFYEARARGGIGLLVLENTNVSYPVGHNGIMQLRIDDERYLPGLHDLVEAVHNWGVKIAIQLNHAGGAAKSKEETQPVAPSPISYHGQPPARELTVPEMVRIAEDFAAAAVRAKRAGFDGVEIHGGHGYLLAQFLSPSMNKREDAYGGNPRARMKFPRQVVEAVRAAVGPDYPILFRLNAEEYWGDRGLTLEEAKLHSQLLVEAGVDALSVTAYGAVAASCPMSFPQAWKAPLSQGVREAIKAKVPVILAGAIKEPQVAEELLEKEQTDFIALGRGLIADPEWPNKARQGKAEDILKCVSCNLGCTGHRAIGWPLGCSVNPVAGREREFVLKPASLAKRVMVVGGGPGGMEAARVAKLRGHDVTLYEKGPRLGGQLTLAALPPGKDKWRWLEEYQIRQLELLGVRVETNSEVTPALVEELRPEAVIVATGATPERPAIPGIERKLVKQAVEVLAGEADLGEGRVVVLGGGLIGLETAVFVAAQGKQVIVLKRSTGFQIDRGDDILDRLKQSQVEIRTGVQVQEVEENGLVFADAQGNTQRIDCGCIVLARGMKANRTLAEELEDKVTELYTIGDSREPRRIRDAMYDGAWAARQI